MGTKMYRASFMGKGPVTIAASSIDEAGNKAKQLVKQSGGMKVCFLLYVELLQLDSSVTA